MSIAILLVGLVIAFLAFRLIAGVVKFVVLGLVLVAVAWFFLHGGMGG
jgi:hypothetical protein